MKSIVLSGSHFSDFPFTFYFLIKKILQSNNITLFDFAIIKIDYNINKDIEKRFKINNIITVNSFKEINLNLYDRIILPDIKNSLKAAVPIFTKLFTKAVKGQVFTYNLTERRVAKLNAAQLLFRTVTGLFTRHNLNRLFAKVTRLINIPFSLSYPRFWAVETTNFCGLKCKLCPTGENRLKRNRGTMSVKNFKILMENIKLVIPYIDNLCMDYYGDSLVDKTIIEKIKYAKECGVKTINISTNGNYNYSNTFFKELILSGLDYVIIPLDGLTQDDYDFFRKGGDLKLVLNFIKKMVEIRMELGRAKPFIVIQVVINKRNYKYLEKYLDILKDYKVDGIKIRRLSERDYNSEDDKYRDIRVDESDSLDIESNRKVIIKNYCNALVNMTVILWNGDVVPCCVDFHGRFVMGNIFNNNFKKIWNNKNYREFRKTVIADRNNIKMCSNCITV